MNSAVVNRELPLKNEGTERIGFGYEKKAPNSRSVQASRAVVLSIVLNRRPDIVFSLFERALEPFKNLLETNASPIGLISESISAAIPKANYILRQPQFIRERAVRRFIPNVRSLKSNEAAQPLLEALNNWAQNNNLMDGWCRDHALATFRAWDVADDKNLAIALAREHDTHCLRAVVKKSWLRALVERQLSGLTIQFQSFAEVEERGVFSFTFQHEKVEFSVPGPFSRSRSEFRRQVQQAFEAGGGGTIRGARKVLQSQLQSYLQQVDKVTEELGLVESRSRWAVDEHFKWLLEYQLPPVKTFRELGREFHKDEKTVREGIRKAAQLVGLSLRSADRDKRLGRPKGAKDRSPRHRVDYGNRKVRGNAS
jgi:hypothetical protein